jgi:hypothetical protein
MTEAQEAAQRRDKVLARRPRHGLRSLDYVIMHPAGCDTFHTLRSLFNPEPLKKRGHKTRPYADRGVGEPPMDPEKIQILFK